MESAILIRSAGANTTVPANVNIVHGTHSELIVWLVLNIWPSHFGIPILLAVILFSKGVRRHPTFINLCITFLIAGISSSLLAYAGKITGPEPAPMLCLLQASLLYGYPPMTSVAAFVLVLQLLLLHRAKYNGKKLLDSDHSVRLWSMLIAPYVPFFIGLLATSVMGSAKPQNVSRSRRFFYCSLQSNSLTNSITIFAALFLFATIFIEGWLVIILYKHWAALRAERMSAEGPSNLSMTLRVVAYGFYSTIALSLSLLSIKAPHSPAPDLMIATAQTAFLLIFATQRDIIGVLCFWRKDRPIAKNPPAAIVISQDQEKVSYFNQDVERNPAGPS